MGLLDIFKTKKPKVMDLPPPPLPVSQAPQDLPELPEIEVPPAPFPDLPLQRQNAEEFPLPEKTPEFEPQEIIAPAPLEEVKVQASDDQEDSAPILQKREPVAPLFVSTTDYQSILNGITEIRRVLGDSESAIGHLSEIKNSEEKIVAEWKSALEDMERKINYVDKVIAKSQQALG